MCFLPSAPTYTPPNDAASTAAMEAAAEAERRRLRAARGRQSTVLTDPLGGPSVEAAARKTLLGQ